MFANWITITRDGRCAIIADTDGFYILNLVTGICQKRLDGFDFGGETATTDGNLALSVFDKDILKIWNLKNGHIEQTLEGNMDFLTGVAITPDKHLAVASSKKGTLKVWDGITGKLLSSFPTSAPLLCCAITPDGRKIIAGDKAGSVHFLEWVGGSEIKETETSQDLKWMMEAAPDSEWTDEITGMATVQGVETRSGWLPRWLKRLLGRQGR
jgi:WD40 repeat protein